MRNSVIEDIECRLVEYKGEVCHDELVFLTDSFLGDDGFVLVKNKVFDNVKFCFVSFEKFKFVNCSFRDCVFCDGSFDDVVFLNCDFEYGVFKSFKFGELVLDKCKLRGAVFLECCFNDLSFCDCDCRGFKFVSCQVLEFEFNDSLITKFDDETFFDKVVRLGKLSKNEKFNFYEDAYKFYSSVSYKFQQNNLLSSYGEYYYLSKLMEQKNLKGISKLKSSILWVICGYGERPTYALFTCLEIIFIFTVLYLIFGLRCGNEVISYKDIFLESKSFVFTVNDFITAFHFSIVTFTTVGYGDVTPIGYSIFLSGVEMFLGVTMVGLWTATLARKISR